MLKSMSRVTIALAKYLTNQYRDAIIMLINIASTFNIITQWGMIYMI